MMNTPIVGLRKVLGDVYPITAISVHYRNFLVEAVDVDGPFVNVPDTRGEMVIVCDDTD